MYWKRKINTIGVGPKLILKELNAEKKSKTMIHIENEKLNFKTK